MSKSEVEQYQLLTTHTADTDLVPRSLSIKQHGIAMQEGLTGSFREGSSLLDALTCWG